MIQLLQLLAALSLMVILHEFGHYITARIFGVKVDKFYLFFNPWFSIAKYKSKKSGTVYGLGWLPLGGYVKLAGMIDESFDTEHLNNEPKPYEFRSKPAWQRLIIMAGGVIMNFLTAIVVYAMLLFSQGQEYVALQDAKMGMNFSEVALNHGFKNGDILISAEGDKLTAFNEDNIRKIFEASNVQVMRNGELVDIAINDSLMLDIIASKSGFADFRFPFVIYETIENTPAYKAGLMAGDSVVSINDSTVLVHSDYTVCFQKHALDTLKLGYYRNGVLSSTTLVPDSAGKIGVYVTPYFQIYKTTKVEYGFFESIPAGIVEGAKKFTGYASDFKYVFTKEGASSLGGFGSIAQIFPDEFNWIYFFNIVAYLSVILAFMNILPIPALDGGHILFLIIEIIKGKPVSQSFMMNAQKIGILILFALLFFANGMDLVRFFN